MVRCTNPSLLPVFVMSSRHTDIRPLLSRTAGAPKRRKRIKSPHATKAIENPVTGSADGLRGRQSQAGVDLRGTLEGTTLTRPASTYQIARPLLAPPVSTFPTVLRSVAPPRRAAPLLGLLKTPCPSLPNLRPLSLFLPFCGRGLPNPAVGRLSRIPPASGLGLFFLDHARLLASGGIATWNVFRDQDGWGVVLVYCPAKGR